MTDIPAGTYVLDPEATTVSVRAAHVGGLGRTTVTFSVLSGTGTVGPDTSAEVHVSVANPRSGNGTRDAVLKSGLWLAATQHPEIVVRVSSLDGTAATGTITVRGVTKPVALELTDVHVDGGRLRAVVEGTVDWRQHGVGMPGMVRRTVDATMNLVADRTA